MSPREATRRQHVNLVITSRPQSEILLSLFGSLSPNDIDIIGCSKRNVSATFNAINMDLAVNEDKNLYTWSTVRDKDPRLRTATTPLAL